MSSIKRTGAIVSLISLALLTLPGAPATAAPLDPGVIQALDLDPATVISSEGPGDARGMTVLTQNMHGFPTQGQSALTLSTGDASIVPGDPDGTIDSTVLDGPGGADGNDLTQVKLELKPPAAAKCLALDFMFLSEEYPDFVGSGFNDIFTAELNESLFQLDGTQVVAPNNFAYDGQANPVSVNTLFGFTAAGESQLNGRSPALSAMTPVETDINSGNMTLFLSVQDLGDSIFDSAVVVDNLRWLYGENCDSGTVPIEDTDGDSLSDEWETNGIDYDNDGTPELDLPAMGADPNHKDIFIEVDWMHKAPECIWFVCWGERDFAPQLAAVEDVVSAFAAAPVSNPDGVSGITAHIDAGPTTKMNPPTAATWGAKSRATDVGHVASLGSYDGSAYDWSDFDSIKQANFDFSRRDAFHYALYADTYAGSGSSGISRGIPASDFILSDGHAGWGGGFTLIQERGTFMHEFGHNLDLFHGGGKTGTLNYDPSYKSIMNYKYQLTGITPGGILDYSRGTPYDDWANIRFDGGSVGDLGDSAPPPAATVPDSIDPQSAKDENVFGATGDGVLAIVGPSVIAAHVTGQSIMVDVTNTGPTTASYTVSSSAGWVSGQGPIQVAAESTQRILLPVDAAVAPLGEAEIELVLANAGVTRSKQSYDVTVVDLSDPATRAAADAALAQLATPPPGLDPAVLAALRSDLAPATPNSPPPTATTNPTVPTTPAPAAPQKPVVKAAADRKKDKIVLSVGPALGKGRQWSFVVQQKKKGKWVSLKVKGKVKVFKTQGKKHRVKVNLPKGTYRVLVTAQYGYAESSSGLVRLKK